MIATAVLAADYAGTLDLLDTTKVAARATQPPPIVSTPTPGKVVLAMDISTVPAARLRLRGRRWDCALGYSPTFTASDVELGFDVQTLHTASTAVGWQDRFWRVGLTESASYGRINTVYLYTQPTGGQPVPPTAGQPGAAMPPTPAQGAGSGTATCNGANGNGGSTCAIDYGSSDTSGSLALRTGRRVTLSLSGGYSVSGGLNTTAQEILPKQYGPRVGAVVAYVASRRDGLDTAASAQETFTSGGCALPLPPTQFCNEQVSIVQLQETLRHQLSPTSTLSLGAGAAASRVQVPRDELVIQPVVGGTFSDRFGHRGANVFSLSTQLAPVVDIRTGIPSERVQTAASLSEPIAPYSTVSVTAGWLQSVPVPTSDPHALTVLSGGIEARIRLDRLLELGLGALESWQNQSGYVTLASTIGYVSLTARAQTQRF
jgi:hypothetical protein